MHHHWQSDTELFQIFRAELSNAVVGDVMDRVGLLHQFLPPALRPLLPTMIVAGRAMPVLEADVFEQANVESTNPLMAQPFGLMFHALDDLQPNEVYICTGASPSFALWGELMSVRAQYVGAAGAVVHGFSRDTHGIARCHFPLFSMGSYAQDQGPRGKVIDYRVPIEIGSVRIRPGDIVFGDVDGVLVIPREAEEEIVHAALEKARGEKLVRQALEQGMSSVAAFAQFGIM